MDEEYKLNIDFARSIRKAGLIEHTSVLGNKKVSYFSGKSFILFLLKNTDSFKNPPAPINDLETISAYGDKLIELKLLSRVVP